MDVPDTPLSALYFDGTSARGHAVQLHLRQGVLRVLGDGIDRSAPIARMQWPERTRHGMRIAHFPDGGTVQCSDVQAWDQWSLAGGHSESWIVTAQQSWRWVGASVLALLMVLVSIQLWGLPAASRYVVAATPLTVDSALGETTLAAIDQTWMGPSKLSEEEQNRLRAAIARNLAPLPAGTLPEWKLLFRQSHIGPNAFALPGGTMILTDEMVELVQGDDKVLTAVIGHELGHVQHRHGMRMVVQSAVLGSLGAVLFGDFSTVLATMPILLGQAQYSRDAEREADAYAVHVLKAASISPAVMVSMFERLQQYQQDQADKKKGASDTPGTAATRQEKTDANEEEDSPLGMAFSSHPADAERIRFFKDAAQ
ncbi:M48 family metallopeptidase [Rhodoferax aquaticus]|nr:M48 family metallopeptidase [Rhodoferax aquaticus]